MDTSETYIKMCVKAEEILPYYDIEPEDFLGNSKTRKESVWLPRQDQLQEMLGCDYKDQLGDFTGFVFDICHDTLSFENYPSQFTSMEQLWLAFYMAEKHNKIWEGEQWILRQ